MGTGDKGTDDKEKELDINSKILQIMKVHTGQVEDKLPILGLDFKNSDDFWAFTFSKYHKMVATLDKSEEVIKVVEFLSFTGFCATWYTISGEAPDIDERINFYKKLAPQVDQMETIDELADIPKPDEKELEEGQQHSNEVICMSYMMEIDRLACRVAPWYVKIKGKSVDQLRPSYVQFMAAAHKWILTETDIDKANLLLSFNLKEDEVAQIKETNKVS
jgi:hypothetical protein